MNNQIKRPNPKFTLEFKQDAVKLVTEQGQTHQQAADSLGISLGAIGRWPRAGVVLQTHLASRRQPWAWRAKLNCYGYAKRSNVYAWA
ncbi:MAG: transposase [Methyloglobulus sp.]|nr:transposase [Methyloglobulus sp.]